MTSNQVLQVEIRMRAQEGGVVYQDYLGTQDDSLQLFMMVSFSLCPG